MSSVTALVADDSLVKLMKEIEESCVFAVLDGMVSVSLSAASRPRMPVAGFLSEVAGWLSLS